MRAAAGPCAWCRCAGRGTWDGGRQVPCTKMFGMICGRGRRARQKEGVQSRAAGSQRYLWLVGQAGALPLRVVKRWVRTRPGVLAHAGQGTKRPEDGSRGPTSLIGLWVRCSTRSSPVHSIPHSVAILTPFILSSCCISGVLTAAPGPGCHVLSWRTDLFIGSLVTYPHARHTLTCLGVVAMMPRPHCSGGIVMLSFEASWELRTVSSTCISY